MSGLRVNQDLGDELVDVTLGMRMRNSCGAGIAFPT